MNKRVHQPMLPPDFTSCGSLSVRLNFVRSSQRHCSPALVAFCAVVWLVFQLAGFSTAQQSSAAKRPANFAQLSTQADAARDADRLDEAIPLYHRALALKPA